MRALPCAQSCCACAKNICTSVVTMQKADTTRVAVASARVLLGPVAFELVAANQIAKGDVLTVSKLAGIMAAKQTAYLIPLCHPLMLSKVRQSNSQAVSLCGKAYLVILAVQRLGSRCCGADNAYILRNPRQRNCEVIAAKTGQSFDLSSGQALNCSACMCCLVVQQHNDHKQEAHIAACESMLECSFSDCVGECSCAMAAFGMSSSIFML